MRALFLAAILFVTSTPAVVAQPHVGVQAVPLANVTWTTGFWANRFETCRTVMIPTMTKIMAGTEHSLFLERFKIASGGIRGGQSRAAVE